MTSPPGQGARRPSGAERTFEDDTGRLWSAGPTHTPQGADAMLFTCLSDSREPPRAVALPPELHLPDAPAATLVALLRGAPKIGRL